MHSQRPSTSSSFPLIPISKITLLTTKRLCSIFVGIPLILPLSSWCLQAFRLSSFRPSFHQQQTIRTFLSHSQVNNHQNQQQQQQTSTIYNQKNSNMAELINGNTIAAQIRLELKDAVADLKESLSVTPGLAVILVGERRDSATYVRSKKKACAEIGMESYGFDFPASITQEELIAKIEELNEG